jgi:hypothetical protein
MLDGFTRTQDQKWLDYQYEIGLRHSRAKKNRMDDVDSVPVVPGPPSHRPRKPTRCTTRTPSSGSCPAWWSMCPEPRSKRGRRRRRPSRRPMDRR